MSDTFILILFVVGAAIGLSIVATIRFFFEDRIDRWFERRSQ